MRHANVTARCARGAQIGRRDSEGGSGVVGGVSLKFGGRGSATAERDEKGHGETAHVIEPVHREL